MSRFLPRCSFCQASVPAQLLYTKEERARIEAEEKKAKERLAAIEAKRKSREAESADGWVPPSINL